jgi:pSer/pThr/pTyr-binding forkhead associated (FHA) protein
LQSPASWEGVEPILVESFPFVIGRSSEADRPLPLVFVSRTHCRFSLVGEEVVVEDLGSANGTYVNGVRLGEATALRHGDEVRLGPLGFRVQMEDVGTVAAGETAKVPLPHEGSTLVVPPPPPGKEDKRANRTSRPGSNAHVGVRHS